jgi:hypothetical protein
MIAEERVFRGCPLTLQCSGLFCFLTYRVQFMDNASDCVTDVFRKSVVGII